MKRIYLIILVLAALSLTLGAKVIKRYGSSHDKTLAITVDSIDFRTDLTRVYGKLLGAPHTSNRIDEASVLVGKKSWKSTDIDGVDFKRYFQWEDDGMIPVEIDFPAMKQFRTATIVFVTPRGESVTNISNR